MNHFSQVIMISTPTIMYLGFAMHKIARMDDKDYRPLRTTTGKKKMPIVTRGAVRDYEEAEDNGEEDPMIAEEIEQEKPGKAEKSKTGSSKCLSRVTIGSLSVAFLALALHCVSLQFFTKVKTIILKL